MPSVSNREAVAAEARRSTYYMAKAVLGFSDMTLATHAPMAEWIQGPSVRKLGLAPRDHLKTSLWTIADTIRRIVVDPNVRILIANETATNASHMLRMIESIFERNPVFRWLFSEVIPKDFTKTKWSEQEMLVRRSNDYPESTVEIIGVGGAVVSRHYNLIKLDDLVGKDASESTEVMRKTIDWYQYAESLLIDPVRDAIHTYGTRWNYRDLYSWIEEHESSYIDRFVRSAEMPDGSALWPERFPLEALARLRDKYGPYKYSCQYLNAPSDPEGCTFKADWLRYFSIDGENAYIEDGGNSSIPAMRKFMRVDPAISQSLKADRTAIVVDGVDSAGRKFVLETFAKRCQPAEMIQQIFQMYRRWDCESVGIERVAFQRILRPFIIDECQRRNIWLNVIDLIPDTRKSKESRIRGCQPYLYRGEVFVQRMQQELINEYTTFPLGQHDDLLDAWAYGPQQWDLPMTDDEDTQFEDWTERSLWNGRCEITGY